MLPVLRRLLHVSRTTFAVMVRYVILVELVTFIARPST